MTMMHLRLTRLRMSAGGRPGWSNLSTILKRKRSWKRRKNTSLETVSQNELLVQRPFVFVNRRLVTECLWQMSQSGWVASHKKFQIRLFSLNFLELNLFWYSYSWPGFNLAEWPLTKSFSSDLFFSLSIFGKSDFSVLSWPQAKSFRSDFLVHALILSACTLNSIWTEWFWWGPFRV